MRKYKIKEGNKVLKRTFNKRQRLTTASNNELRERAADDEAATKRARAAGAMATVMRVAGDEEGARAARVAGDEEGEDGKAMVTATRVVGERQRRRRRGR